MNANPTIALITPTGGRPKAWALCERYLSRQTYPEWVWYIVDDCEPMQEYTLPNQQIVIRPEWRWKPGQNTQARNMHLLLTTAVAAGANTILIIEDDEWYSPRYVEQMVELLQHWPIVGEGKAKYYCIKNRTWRIYDNIDYACLCRTGISATYASELMRHFDDYPENIDKHFWRNCSEQGKVVFDLHLSVGIKGMPGRLGLSRAHQGHKSYAQDRHGNKLAEWIGVDTKWYETFYAPTDHRGDDGWRRLFRWAGNRRLSPVATVGTGGVQG